ncbi:dsDNA nuclease domain-containing protein [Azospirillum endophyticum]
MYNLHDTVVNSAPREMSGAWTSTLYDYQRYLSIYKIIELHSRGKDYRVAFDYFDDIMIFNHSTNPTAVDFYQVKVSITGPWSMADIVRPESKNRPTSIISKMYHNISVFGAHANYITFITNSYFKFSLPSGELTSHTSKNICASTLDLTERKKIEEAVDADFPRAGGSFCDKVYFESCDLQPSGQSHTIQGKINDYFVSIGYEAGVPVKALTDSLFGEVSRKSGVENSCSDIVDFYNKRTICREWIQDLFLKATTYPMIKEYWSDIQDELKSAGYGAPEIADIKKMCFEYIIKRAGGEPLFNKYSDEVQSIINSHPNLFGKRDTYLKRTDKLSALLVGQADWNLADDQLLSVLIVHVVEDHHAKAANLWVGAIAESTGGAR